MQQATDAQVPTPAVPAPPAAPNPNIVYSRQGALTGDPTARYEAMLAQRDELNQQLDNLRRQRNRITEELSNSETRGVDKQGLESRLQATDARIAEVDKALAQADANVSAAAAVPSAVAGHVARQRAERRADQANEADPGPYLLGALFMVVAVLPLTIAYSRRIWRRGAAAVSALPGDIVERFSHLDQAMESIAIEVERIGEGQRFITRVMTESNSRALGAAPAEPIRQAAREAVPASSGETRR